MRLQKKSALFASFLAIGSVVLLLGSNTNLPAGEVFLKNGMRLEGSLVYISGLNTTLLHQKKDRPTPIPYSWLIRE